MTRQKRRPRLKPGTRDYATKNVSLAPCPWDLGASGQANRIGLVREQRGEINLETGEMQNANNIEGVRRLSVAGHYLARKMLTARQYIAADILLRAWEQKDRRPPAINEAKVDSSPKPDDHTIMIIERAMEYAHISAHVPEKYAAYVFHVARDNQFISMMPGYKRNGVAMERLREGLDLFADALERRPRR